MPKDVRITLHVQQTHAIMLATCALTIYWPDDTTEIFLGKGDDPIFAVGSAIDMAEEQYGPIDPILYEPLTAQIII